MICCVKALLLASAVQIEDHHLTALPESRAKPSGYLHQLDTADHLPSTITTDPPPLLRHRWRLVCDTSGRSLGDGRLGFDDYLLLQEVD